MLWKRDGCDRLKRRVSVKISLKKAKEMSRPATVNPHSRRQHRCKAHRSLGSFMDSRKQTWLRECQKGWKIYKPSETMWLVAGKIMWPHQNFVVVVDFSFVCLVDFLFCFNWRRRKRRPWIKRRHVHFKESFCLVWGTETGSCIGKSETFEK